jgi:hypothetical protein
MVTHSNQPALETTEDKTDKLILNHWPTFIHHKHDGFALSAHNILEEKTENFGKGIDRHEHH